MRVAAVRVMIAEDSALLRLLLAEALSARGFTVAGEAADPESLHDLVDADPPDAVVLDIRMPPTQRDEGIRAAERIRARHPRVALLVLSAYGETSYAIRLLRHTDHAVGYLVKDRVRDADGLADTLRRVIAGEVVIDSELVTRMMRRRRQDDPLDRLTDTERRVLAAMAEGQSNTAIARGLGCRPKTVEKHVTTICRALGLPDFADEARADVNVRVLAVLTYLRSPTG